MTEREIRRRLRQWDPAAGVAPPRAELYAGIRDRLGRDGARRSRWRLGRRWAAAALTAAATALVVVTLARLDRQRTARPEVTATAVTAAAAESAPVQIVYTAANGVRIYWQLAPTPASRM